jgi:hypothetical protein
MAGDYRARACIGDPGERVIRDNIMAWRNHPLDLAAGARLRVAWALALIALLWGAILWAMAA